ncbi:molybdopterin molybdotransferase MoeA [Helicobacter mehlei]|uniref:Molybdopterin molybdenumtransferase n=1 Tax=Helicobacter mehlei TaxID=2316080 RepID=A0A553UUA3_9HELI|nr:molybdopterin molybdotransferase MoeA [Helicobacter mehlei]TSA83788.1 molybdopterin molybdotransferase MoeA [Helicobacter mehlei]
MNQKLITFVEALQIGLNLPCPTHQTERIKLEEGLGRIVSEDIVALEDLPKATHSAMDGFAFALEDLGACVGVACVVYAGMDVSSLELPKGACVKIMTGALLPKGLDLVVPFEEMLEFDDKHAQAPKHKPNQQAFKKGDNVRFQGEDLQKGAILVKKGTRLHMGLLALLASQGVAVIPVFKRLKVGVVSSGDEIVPLGTKALPHQIYDSNALALVALLKDHGYEAQHLGKLGDDLEAQKHAIEGFLDYDVVLSSAGVSVGDKDYFKEALAQMGAKIHYHGVNVKPGKPIMLASLQKQGRSTLVFGLPGNPLSCLLTFLALGLPVLEKQAGSLATLSSVKARLSEPLKLKGDRAHLILGHLDQGIFTPYRNNRYSSGALDALGACQTVALVQGNTEEIEVFFYKRFL